MLSTTWQMAEHVLDADGLAVTRVLSGDRQAFTALYERHYSRVYSLVRGIVLNDFDADDVTQNVFTQAFRKLKQFDQRSRFGTWLYRIAVNQSIQFIRSRNYDRRTVSLDDSFEPAVEADEGAAPMDPHVQRAMQLLSPEDRAILGLFYWDELTLIEIGDALGCGANAAKTRLFRARERFKQVYEEVQ